MLKFASICPHPPIIIPTIGSSRDLERVSKTIKAMERLAKIFQHSQPETVIVISPHGPVSYHDIAVTMSPALSGNLKAFGDYETEMNFENDLELVDILQEKCRERKIPLKLMDEPQLDHGSLVPLYYLTHAYRQAGKDYKPKGGKILKVVPVAYSFLNRQINFEFGKKLFEVCNIKGKTKKRRIAIVASGDLSHRLTFEAPAGFNPRGAEFDEKIIELLEENNTKKILEMDSELLKEAGECGYLSIVVLLGVLSKTGLKSEIFSYEGPFGVGYSVVNFR